jgi:hypothetical protein
MRRLALVILALVGVALAAVAWAGGAGDPAAKAQASKGLTPLQQKLMSGFASRALEERTAPGLAPRVQGMRQAPGGVGSTSETGCPANRGANVRVNQNCLNLSDPDLQGRGQAQNETAIAQDPNNLSRIVASQNDYRRGDGGCYTGYSSNGGRTWTDSTPPMGFTRGTPFGGFARQYWQAGGDTSVAWDTKGNAYLSCQMFMRGQPVSNNLDKSSAFYVFRSTGTGGASWNFPGRPVAEHNDVAGAGDVLLDKQYMTIDNTERSPFQDRIYVTWTLFDADGTSYIFGAHSRDYGEHFSSPTLISGDSALCTNPRGAPTPHGRCNENQFSQPFTGPDGALYVVWDNFNVTGSGAGEGGEDGGDFGTNAAPQGVDNHQQVLLAKSTDGGNSFSAPVKVADFYDLPDCVTYQGDDAGVSCVPEKGETTNSIFRAENYPSGAVDPTNGREVVVTLGSYINRHSNEGNGCVPQGFNPDTFQPLYDGVKTAGACNNDVVISRSTNAGQSFTGGSTDVRELPATRAVDAKLADQFWQWAAFDPRGRLAVSYYDRAYGDDETTGFSDISLSGSRNAGDFATTRVTSSSMPPPTQFSGDFYGDYSGLSAADVAHPAWMDTRDPNLFVCRDSAGNVTLPPSVCTASAPQAKVANDQNIYTQALSVPVP